MRKASIIVGFLGGGFTLALWIIYIFYNPYTATSQTSEGVMATFIMLVLPAFIAIVATFMNKKYLMLIAFLWSIPISLYLLFTPGVFAWFFLSSIAYFISFLMMFIEGYIRKSIFIAGE